VNLVIVDTGCANLASVKFAFERLGVNANITDDAETIISADRVVLPGVGSAPFAMKSIHNKNLSSTLRHLNQPIMGICLGMQLIFETLEEGGSETEGLGLLPGRIKTLDTKNQPSPHMGWNTLTKVSDDPLLEGINDNDYAYFVHSFAAPVSDITLASCEYGTKFTAIVRKDNVYGCQFHPERSSKVGARILENFLKVPA